MTNDTVAAIIDDHENAILATLDTGPLDDELFSQVESDALAAAASDVTGELDAELFDADVEWSERTTQDWPIGEPMASLSERYKAAA